MILSRLSRPTYCVNISSVIDGCDDDNVPSHARLFKYCNVSSGHKNKYRSIGFCVHMRIVCLCDTQSGAAIRNISYTQYLNGVFFSSLGDIRVIFFSGLVCTKSNTVSYECGIYALFQRDMIILIEPNESRSSDWMFAGSFAPFVGTSQHSQQQDNSLLSKIRNICHTHSDTAIR